MRTFGLFPLGEIGLLINHEDLKYPSQLAFSPIMKYGLTTFLLLCTSPFTWAQATLTSEDLLSGYSRRSSHFTTYVVGDSIMMASIGRYRTLQWTDYPRLLKTDAHGADIQIFDLNNVNPICPVGRGASWTNSKGYLLFSDTTTYAGYKDQTTLSQCFSFHEYGSDSILWQGEGSFYVPYGNGNQITVASNSTFWIDNILREEFTAVDQSTGDTLKVLPYDSIAQHYPAPSDYSLYEYVLFAPLRSTSDSAYGFAHFFKWDSVGNPVSSKSYYSLIDLKDLSLLAPPTVWPPTVSYFDPNGFGVLKDTIEYYPSGNFYRKTITSERIYSALIDTVLVVDSLNYHPDTLKFPIDNRFFLTRTNGDYTLYAEEINQYRDTINFGQLTTETVLLRMYKGLDLLYEKTLVTNIFSGDGDIRLRNAFVLNDGRVILNLKIGGIDGGYRIAFLDTNGSNYLSIEEQLFEIESPKLEIFPTLVDREIQVISSSEIIDIIILDVMGREQMKSFPKERPIQIAVDDLTPGIYFLKVAFADGSISSERFIKK